MAVDKRQVYKKKLFYAVWLYTGTLFWGKVSGFGHRCTKAWRTKLFICTPVIPARSGENGEENPGAGLVVKCRGAKRRESQYPVCPEWLLERSGKWLRTSRWQKLFRVRLHTVIDVKNLSFDC